MWRNFFKGDFLNAWEFRVFLNCNLCFYSWRPLYFGFYDTTLLLILNTNFLNSTIECSMSDKKMWKVYYIYKILQGSRINRRYIFGESKRERERWERERLIYYRNWLRKLWWLWSPTICPLQATEPGNKIQ